MVEFGREVETDKIVLVLHQHDGQDRTWTGATLEFSNGGKVPITLRNTSQPQEFTFKSMVLHAKDFATEDSSFDKNFRWIDLGVIDFVPGAYFWFAHGHHPELDAIFVDRVVLIGAETSD